MSGFYEKFTSKIFLQLFAPNKFLVCPLFAPDKFLDTKEVIDAVSKEQIGYFNLLNKISEAFNIVITDYLLSQDRISVLSNLNCCPEKDDVKSHLRTFVKSLNKFKNFYIRRTTSPFSFTVSFPSRRIMYLFLSYIVGMTVKLFLFFVFHCANLSHPLCFFFFCCCWPFFSLFLVSCSLTGKSAKQWNEILWH